MMSDFFRRFMAKNSPDLRLLASITLPKDPTLLNDRIGKEFKEEIGLYGKDVLLRVIDN